MIVGDYECFVGSLRDFADARDPGREFFGGVEIVVALVRGDGFVVREPSVVAPAVQPHVAYGRCGLRGGPRDRPIMVGLCCRNLHRCAQQFQCFCRIPRTMAYFDDQGIVAKRLLGQRGSRPSRLCDETKKGIAAGPRQASSPRAAHRSPREWRVHPPRRSRTILTECRA